MGLILRYIVEGEFSKSFTSSERIDSEFSAEYRAMRLSLRKRKDGGMKYSGFKLYEEGKFIKDIIINHDHNN